MLVLSMRRFSPKVMSCQVELSWKSESDSAAHYCRTVYLLIDVQINFAA